MQCEGLIAERHDVLLYKEADKTLSHAHLKFFSTYTYEGIHLAVSHIDLFDF